MSSGMILVIGNLKLPGNVPCIYAGEVHEVDCPGCVVVLSENAAVPLIKRAAGVVVNGDCCGAIPTGRLGGVQLVTCGRCVKNTVSVTSDSGDRMTLALSRAVTTLHGVCEPMELPLERSPGVTEYGCMAAFSAAVILDMCSG